MSYLPSLSFGFGSSTAEANLEEDELVVVDHPEVEPVASQSSTASTNTSASSSTALSSNTSPGTALQNSDPTIMSEDFSTYNDTMLVSLMVANDREILQRKIQLRKTTDQEEKDVLKEDLDRLEKRKKSLGESIRKAATQSRAPDNSGNDARDRQTYQNKILNALKNINTFIGPPMDVHEFIEDVKAKRVLIVKSPDQDTRPWLAGMFFDSVMENLLDSKIIKMMQQSSAIPSDFDELSDYLTSKCGLDEGYMHRMLKFFEMPCPANQFPEWCSTLQSKVENLRHFVRADFRTKFDKNMAEEDVWKMLAAIVAGQHVAKNAAALGVTWEVLAEKLDACYDPLDVGKAVKQHREKIGLGPTVAVNNVSLMHEANRSVAKESGSSDASSQPQHCSDDSRQTTAHRSANPQTSARHSGNGQQSRPPKKNNSRRGRRGSKNGMENLLHSKHSSFVAKRLMQQ